MATTVENSLDLNSLFNLNYNFDILKTVIQNIMSSNKSTNQKLNDLIEKIEKKDNIISR